MVLKATKLINIIQVTLKIVFDFMLGIGCLVLGVGY